MTHIATKTVKYHVKPGVVFGLVEGKEVVANGFNLAELLRSGLVRKKNIVEIGKDKIAFAQAKKATAKAKAEAKKEAEAEATLAALVKTEEVEEVEEASKKRGRPKKS